MKLNTLQHSLKVKGKFETIIRNQTCCKPAAFVVVKGRINSPPLLSKDTLIQLGMLKIQSDGRLTSRNAMRIANDESKTIKSTTKTPPFRLQKPLKERLQQGVEEGIFEQVPENEPITWCSSLVIQPKLRFSPRHPRKN